MDEKLTNIFLSIRGSLARAVAGIVPPKEIEDIVQETYVRACQTRSDRKIESPRSFMFKTARNLALNYINRSEVRLSQSYEDIEMLQDSELLTGLSEDTLDQVCVHEEFSLLCEAVRRLPIQCRRVFVLKKVYGHTQREIANILGISEKTVENHITNGIKRCRQYTLNQEKSGHQKSLDNGGRIDNMRGNR